MQYEIDATPEELDNTLNHAIRSNLFANGPAVHRVIARKVRDAARSHRPVDQSGKHTDELHTPTCGCEDKGPCRYEERVLNTFDDSMMICRNHEQPSKHDVSVYPHYPCLAVDPYDTEVTDLEVVDNRIVVHTYYGSDNKKLCEAEEIRLGEMLASTIAFTPRVYCATCANIKETIRAESSK